MDAYKRALEIMELSPEATPGEIKQAYRDLAKVWHPDRFQENSRVRNKAEKKLKEINQAYKILQNFSTNFHPEFNHTSNTKPNKHYSNNEQQTYSSEKNASSSSSRSNNSKKAESPQNTIIHFKLVDKIFGLSLVVVLSFLLLIFLVEIFENIYKTNEIEESVIHNVNSFDVIKLENGIILEGVIISEGDYIQIECIGGTFTIPALSILNISRSKPGESMILMAKHLYQSNQLIRAEHWAKRARV